MTARLDPKLAHDLRAPLARARSYARMLREDCKGEQGEQAELAEAVLKALEDLERLLRDAEGPAP